MRPVSFYMQKVMVPIGIYQRPVLEYVVRHLVRNGINDFVFLVGYKHQQIRGYFRGGDGFGARITYVVDPPRFQGTGAALLNASHVLEEEDEDFLVYYTDILTSANLAEMHEFHKSHNAKATLLVSKGLRLPVGIADLDSDLTVTTFKEKPLMEEVYVNTGISILNRSVIEDLQELSKERSNIDLSGHLLPLLVRQKQLKAHVTDAWWEDIGSIERYEKRNDEEISLHMGLDTMFR